MVLDPFVLLSEGIARVEVDEVPMDTTLGPTPVDSGSSAKSRWSARTGLGIYRELTYDCFGSVPIPYVIYRDIEICPSRYGCINGNG